MTHKCFNSQRGIVSAQKQEQERVPICRVESGWHKLEGGLAYLEHGTPWTLEKEVAEIGFPVPMASAFAATAVQFL